MEFLLNSIVVQWVVKTFFKKRLVMAVDSSGKQHVRCLRYTDGGKAYLRISGNSIGFLDNPSQREGEFRSNISTGNLVRWFNI